MAIKKRGDRWWVDIRLNRRRYRKPSPENSKVGAQAYEAVLRQKLARGESIEVKVIDKTITLAEFAPIWTRDYVEVNNKPSVITTKRNIMRAHLVPFFGKMELSQITNHVVEQFKATKQRAGKSPKSINNYMSILRRLLTSAEEWEIIDRVPKMKQLKVMSYKTDFLTINECEMLLRSADDVWRDMILFVMKTGLRFGEFVALKWVDVDFNNQQITVCRSIVHDIPQESTKSNRIRYVPFGEELRQLLYMRKNLNFGDYVFSHADGHFLKADSCRRALNKVVDDCGLRRVGWHLLRHTFASHLAEKGLSPIIIQNLLGHSDIKTTMRYAHLGQGVIREAVLQLERPASNNFGHNLVTIIDNNQIVLDVPRQYYR